MPRLRIALAQVDLTVGDLAGNADVVVEQTRAAAAEGAQLVAFPEMALTGYPPEDLVLRGSFVEASRNALDLLAARLNDVGVGDIGVVVGYLDRCANPAPRVGRPAGEPQNAAAFIHHGEVVARYAKHHLPNYGVFDEFRYFVPGDTLPVIRFGEVDIAMTICEDLWQEGGPIAVAREAGVGLVVCINGSPYERNKDDVRLELVTRRATEANATLAYVNLVGGQDELVFDGDSLIVDADGRKCARALQFRPYLLVADLELPTGNSEVAGLLDAHDGTTMTVTRHAADARPAPVGAYEATESIRIDDEPEFAEVWEALVLGTGDYVRKNGFTSVVLGLSGGIDSALVAAIACDALGADAVHVVGMPSRYSSDGSVTDAEELARRQGLHWEVLPIAAMVEAYEKAFGDLAVGGLHGLAEENLQARVRGTSLMALSNQAGHLVLTTGNKSELATGFSTLYGDSAGGFAPIKDVPKTLVWELSRWRNARARDRGEVEPIPVEIIDKEPSAELAPGQLDRDRLPDYATLDAILDAYVERDLGRAELITLGHPPELVDRVIRLVDLAEYKRRQYPPGPKITPKGFGRDRRLPITNRWREAP
ncbi:MAG TPA: NAD+ synthase [Mycobacteriales bacterium]|jgi:NAD+ synthase (glutamine-hydrolysing)|nr:NAD+ synthase [Mycobacteriales bacterium]